MIDAIKQLLEKDPT